MTNHNKTFFFLMYLFFLIILFYAVQDFRTSANTFVKVGNRNWVHVTLLLIIAFAGLYHGLTFWREIIFSPVKVSLWLIVVWIALANIYHGRYEWTTAIHFGLSCLWVLSYHFFCHYIRRSPEVLPQIKFCIAIMFMFYVFSAFFAMISIHNYLANVGEDRPAVVNMAYNVIVFMPWLSIVESKKRQIIGLGIILLTVLCSMKRGAIIVFPLMLSVWLLTNAAIMKKRFLGTIFIIILFFSIFVAGLVVADQLSKGFLSKRFSSEELVDGSGRAGALKLAFKQISGWSLGDFTFGIGQSFFSHNEWFAFLYNYGLIGVVLYAILLMSLTGRLWHLIKKSSPLAPGCAMVLAYISIVGLYGPIYFVHSTLYLMIFLGVIEGLMFSSSWDSRHFNPHNYII